MKSLSQEQIAQIGKDYSECHSFRKTCRRLNIYIGTAHKYTSKLNIINRQNIVKRLKSRNERLIGLYIGLWMGDGTQYYDKGYTVKICSNKNNRLLNQFIIHSILQLFGKKAVVHNISNTNQAYIKFSSKFIFNFVYNYVDRDLNKTHSVRLKENIQMYSKEFLEGCLLGLSLSDGYLKKKFRFSVTSEKLAENTSDILTKLGSNPRIYLDNRQKYGWKNLHTVYLTISDSTKVESLLDKILKKLKCNYTFQELKYEMGPAGFEPATATVSV